MAPQDEAAALKEFSNISLQRWANRRSYEWQLSYVIWTALAGFIAIVVFGKDSHFQPTKYWLWAAVPWLLIIIALHFCYLRGMVLRTLSDLEDQHLFQKALTGVLRYDPLANKKSELKDFDPGHAKHWYGLVAQTGLTALLSVAIFFFIWAKIPREGEGNNQGDEKKACKEQDSMNKPDNSGETFMIAESGKVYVGTPHTHTLLINRRTGEVWLMRCDGTSTIQFTAVKVEGLEKPSKGVTQKAKH